MPNGVIQENVVKMKDSNIFLIIFFGIYANYWDVLDAKTRHIIERN